MYGGGKSAWKFNVGNCKATWSWQLEWKTNQKHQKNTEVLLDIWYWKKCWRHPKITKRCTLANELPNITLFMFFNCLTSPLPSPQKNITITKLRCFFQLKVLVRCLKGLSLLASSSFDFIGLSVSQQVTWYTDRYVVAQSIIASRNICPPEPESRNNATSMTKADMTSGKRNPCYI